VAQRTDFAAMACSLARSWSIIGEPWTPLVIRDLSMGITRFEDLCADLGISRNILTDRLRTLTVAGVVAKRDYRSPNRARSEYVLTEMGEELLPIVVAITQWGDRWLDDEAGPPIIFEHICGATIRAETICNSCGQPLVATEVAAYAGPGSKTGPGTNAAHQLPTHIEGHPRLARK
jgi:DNA-binding HxlR family transcriptional regulator